MLKRIEEFFRMQNLFSEQQRFLLAVSGGVDSMVLLYMLEQLSNKYSLSFAVAHINHKLRKESEQEARYLKEYCQTKNITYYEQSWQEGNKEKNTEARARAFRYRFFAQIMKNENYSCLLTAHHGDDQAETILMKLVRGTKLTNLVGIRANQPFAEGRLLRPLLFYSKEEIRTFAEREKLQYFEDSSNISSRYFRNRIRKKVIPELKQENAQFLAHMNSFGKQMELADELITSVVAPKYEQWVIPIAGGWKIKLEEWRLSSESVQFFFLLHLLQQTLINKNINVQQAQYQQILQALQSEKPQTTTMLEKGWQFQTSYDEGFLIKKTKKELESTQPFFLNPQTAVFLSANEWLAFEEIHSSVPVPPSVAGWKSEELLLSETVQLPLEIRHRQNGDRITLGAGWTKKVSRLFIDGKIPNEQREKAWLVLSNNQILWIPKFINSYLSIPKETDKIHYRLLYKTKE